MTPNDGDVDKQPRHDAGKSKVEVNVKRKPGVEKLYILNCGEGIAGDISRWSPGVNVGKSMDFVDNCYLIRHTQGWLLWDTGVTDAIAAMPEGQAPADPRMTHWRRPKTLASQLEQLAVKPSDIKFLAVSHTHPDHIGNVGLFPTSMLLVQKAEYEWPSPLGVGRFKPEQPATKLEGDHAGIFAVHTAKAWRGRGLGRAIVAALLAESRRRGATRAYLQVTADNAPALALYDRFGFATAYVYWYRTRREERI